jgi:D-serine deaminase-like pyridoxal phosphate-dependent protein
LDARAYALSVAEMERDLMLALSSRLQSFFNIPVPVISIGASPSSTALVAQLEKSAVGFNFEIHPGNFIFYDRQQVESGSCTLNDVACYVVARVIARYSNRNEFLIDAGGCALHKDLAGLHDGTYGCLQEDPTLVITKLTQEVAVVGRLGGGTIDLSNFPPGKVVRVIPNHSCMTAACHEVFHVVDRSEDRRVIDTWRPVKFW